MIDNIFNFFHPKMNELVKQINKSDSCCIISAYKKDSTEEENYQRHRDILVYFKSYWYPIMRVEGRSDLFDNETLIVVFGSQEILQKRLDSIKIHFDIDVAEMVTDISSFQHERLDSFIVKNVSKEDKPSGFVVVMGIHSSAETIKKQMIKNPTIRNINPFNAHELEKEWADPIQTPDRLFNWSRKHDYGMISSYCDKEEYSSREHKQRHKSLYLSINSCMQLSTSFLFLMFKIKEI